MEGDDSYTSAALRGCGCDCGGSYTDAALRGTGKFKKGSPEAKAFMAHLRAMRGTKSKAGKKLKGGVAFSTIAAALGLIPTAIKGAHAIYKWIKGSGILKGGRNVYLDPVLRNAYIENEIDGKYTGLTKAQKMPYRIGSPAAKKAYNSRLNRIPKSVRNYLSYKDPQELNDIIADVRKMRDKIQGIQSTLEKPQHKIFSAKKPKKKSRTPTKIRFSLADLGLPDGQM